MLILTAGCATYEPAPKDYSGPTATLRDTGVSEDGGKARIFAAVEIDDNRIMNAFWASANASQGRGNNLTTTYPERRVRAAPMKVKLRCSHATGAPIAAIASQVAGTFFSVDGTVEFTPESGGNYIVKGSLTKERSTCWIEDAASGKPVTAVLSK
jgi:hypothetical protein